MKFSETAVFVSSGLPIELRRIPVPDPGLGEILVRNEFTTLCRSDLNTYVGKRIEPSPTILGHEIVGRIAEFGPGAPTLDIRGSRLKLGDRISWAIFASDPEDELAKIGIPQKGAHLFKYGHQQLTETSVLHGGLSQYILLRPHTPIVKIDESMPVEIAAVINCAAATSAGGLRLAGEIGKKNILIAGAGMLGLIACAMAKTRGAAMVSVLDVNEERLEVARRFGADVCLYAGDRLKEKTALAFGRPNPFHATIDLSGSVSAMEQMLELLGIGGTAVWIGAVSPQRDVRINAEKLVRNLHTIKGLHNYNREDFLIAVEFMERFHSAFPFGHLIHESFPLREVNQAFEYAISANPFRVGVRID